MACRKERRTRHGKVESLNPRQELRENFFFSRVHFSCWLLFAEPLWTDPGLKSGLSVCELISTLKKKRKKAQAGNKLLNILPKSSHASKKATTLFGVRSTHPPLCYRSGT